MISGLEISRFNLTHNDFNRGSISSTLLVKQCLTRTDWLSTTSSEEAFQVVNLVEKNSLAHVKGLERYHKSRLARTKLRIFYRGGELEKSNTYNIQNHKISMIYSFSVTRLHAKIITNYRNCLISKTINSLLTKTR